MIFANYIMNEINIPSLINGMQDQFKRFFILATKYLPMIYSTVVALFCCNQIFVLDLIIKPTSIQALMMLFSLSIIFKYCQYHKMLILFSMSFWILYYIQILNYNILYIYLILYIILFIYGFKNKFIKHTIK